MCHVITIQRAEFYVQRIGLLKIVYKTYYSDLKYSNNVKKVACHFTSSMLSQTIMNCYMTCIAIEYVILTIDQG